MNFKTWATHTFRWAGEARLVWFSLLFLVAGLLIVVGFRGEAEPACRVVGLVYQLLGVGTVALDLRSKRVLYNAPSAWSDATAWWRRRPQLGVVPLSAHLAASTTAAASLKVVFSAKTFGGSTIEEQVADLRRNVGDLQRDVAGLGQMLEVEVHERKAAGELETAERRKHLDHLGEEVRTVHVGGIGLATFGILFLVIGLVIATLSPEIAQFVGRR